MTKRFTDRLMAVDHRIIYVILAIAVFAPLLLPDLILPVTITDPVRNLFEEVEKLSPGDRIFLSMDFDPTLDPEMSPMAQVFLKHCYRKGVRVTAMTLWPQGVTLGFENMLAASKQKYRERVLTTDGAERIVDRELEAREYENWVFLGAQPGG